ncbi:hypothetical protein BXZ70DRAFT_1013274 [Cristinia sonorae]|uniref:Uncharacterized protein n=1 Tax=Cristinia sonorae TaxID=1940300 RepID=A0A8K0UCV6_9AGAR|nr:hypothetical protein BXZ70DRAFT_1013274 [Cristinia sonorae]
MNHSPEPGSPISGSTSSDSESETIPSHFRGAIAQRPSWAMLGGGSSASARHDISDFAGPGKRRVPPGSSLNASRDAKSRRREEASGGGAAGRRGQTQGSGHWGDGASKKDDLVDQYIVENLRIQFGDPFDDNAMKVSSS